MQPIPTMPTPHEKSKAGGSTVVMPKAVKADATTLKVPIETAIKEIKLAAENIYEQSDKQFTETGKFCTKEQSEQRAALLIDDIYSKICFGNVDANSNFKYQEIVKILDKKGYSFHLSGFDRNDSTALSVTLDKVRDAGTYDAKNLKLDWVDISSSRAIPIHVVEESVVTPYVNRYYENFQNVTTSILGITELRNDGYMGIKLYSSPESDPAAKMAIPNEVGHVVFHKAIKMGGSETVVISSPPDKKQYSVLQVSEAFSDLCSFKADQSLLEFKQQVLDRLVPMQEIQQYAMSKDLLDDVFKQVKPQLGNFRQAIKDPALRAKLIKDPSSLSHEEAMCVIEQGQLMESFRDGVVQLYEGNLKPIYTELAKSQR